MTVSSAPTIEDFTPPEPTPNDPEWNGIARDSSGSGTGLYCSDEGEAQEAAAEMADVLQEAAIEGLWRLGTATNWPPCPEHPDRHPLEPVLREGTAAWACPKTGTLAAPLGELRPPDRA